MSPIAKSIYLKELDNAISLNYCDSSSGYNNVVFRYLGFRSDTVIRVLTFFSPVLRIGMIIFSLVFFIFRFFVNSIINISHQRPPHVSGRQYYLFFLPLFLNRLKAADLYADSRFWIFGPNISRQTTVENKIIIKYQDFLVSSDYLLVLKRSLKTIIEYIKNYRCIYPIFKAWDLYEVEVALEYATVDCDIIFANQSDRWALMFDNLPAKTKILVQHGVASSTLVVPHRLKNIDRMYAISRQTVDDMFFSVLECEPEVRYMKPTITLEDTGVKGFTVLLVSHIMFFEIESKVVERLYNLGCTIFLKKHPEVKNDNCYKELQLEFPFNYITDGTFPNVDCVVSYESTLAYEYLSHGKKVFFYDPHKGLNNEALTLFIKKAKEDFYE